MSYFLFLFYTHIITQVYLDIPSVWPRLSIDVRDYNLFRLKRFIIDLIDMNYKLTKRSH